MHPAGHQDRQPTHTVPQYVSDKMSDRWESMPRWRSTEERHLYNLWLLFFGHFSPTSRSHLAIHAEGKKRGVAGAVQTPLAIMMAVLALQHFLVWRLREVIYKIFLVVGFNRHSCNPWLWKWREHYGYGQKHVPYIPHFWLSDLWKNVASPWRIRSYSIHKFKISYIMLYIYIFLFMGYKHMTYYIYIIFDYLMIFPSQVQHISH